MRQQRVVVVFAALAVAYALLLVPLLRLQVVEHEMWARESARSTLRYRSLPFERGWILDRHGEPLARTEEVSDLVFEYREWRRRSVAGAVSAAERTRHGADVDVPGALERAEELLAAFADLRLADIAALEPRDRRGDLLFYVGALFGEAVEEAALAGLRAGGAALEQRLAALDGFAAGADRSLERHRRERAALPDLAAVLGDELHELVAGMEEARRRAEDDVLLQVADLLESRRDGPPPDFAELRAFLDTREGYAAAAAARRQFDGRPRRLADAVPYDTQTLVELRARDFPGFRLDPQTRRVYPAYRGRAVAPLVIGDVGPPSEFLHPGDSELHALDLAAANRQRLVDLASLADPTDAELRELEELRLAVREIDYRTDEEAGRRGLERVLEPVLRGKRGWVASQLDERGRSVERREPQRGLNVTLTLDVALQAAAEEVLDEIYAEPPLGGSASPRWTGALVVLDPRDGELLALASGPRASRDAFRGAYRQLLEHPDAPLRQRALRAGATGNLPPPGSVFKPATALAWRAWARAAGEPDLDPEHWCGRTLGLGTRSMSCLGSHGTIGLRAALARSCNIYFYHLGRQMGSDPLYAMADRFGFGSRSRIVVGNARLTAAGVPLDERAGVEGLQEEVNPIAGGERGDFDAMRFAIGQAPLDDVTPLQVAVMMGAVGTGRLAPPGLVRDVEGFALPPAEPRWLGFDPGDLADVHAGMLAVVESPQGTAHELTQLWEHAPYDRLAGRLAAKTGTAEVGGERPDHAWLAGFFPADDPRVAFAVLIEEVGLHGGEAAVPVFARFLRKPAVAAWLEHEVLGPEAALR